MRHNEKMPILFIGHGSPMNAIDDNRFTKGWEKCVHEIPKPKAILVISAHWFTHETKITDIRRPRMIYDMYGFPDALYEVIYDVEGSPDFAHLTHALIPLDASIDNSLGLDHGAWSVLIKMYPSADIPVYQMSVDCDKPLKDHYKLGQKIRVLREQGVLILASGNVVHNLRLLDWESKAGFGWAERFDAFIKDKILTGDHEAIMNAALNKDYALAVPTPDHFLPLLYILGASDPNDKITVFNEECIMGSLSTTSYLLKA